MLTFFLKSLIILGETALLVAFIIYTLRYVLDDVKFIIHDKPNRKHYYKEEPAMEWLKKQQEIQKDQEANMAKEKKEKKDVDR